MANNKKISAFDTTATVGTPATIDLSKVTGIAAYGENSTGLPDTNIRFSGNDLISALSASTTLSVGVMKFTASQSSTGTQYIGFTQATDSVGNVNLGEINLNAADGSATGSTKFLTKDNNWATPSYTTAYTLPSASPSVLGGVQTGATNLATKNYAVQVDSQTRMFVAVPWTDTQNTYTAGDGLQLNNFQFSLSTPVSVEDGGTSLEAIGEGQIIYGNDNNEFVTGSLEIDIDNNESRLVIGKNAGGNASGGNSGEIELLSSNMSGDTDTSNPVEVKFNCRTNGHYTSFLGPKHDSGNAENLRMYLPNRLPEIGDVLTVVSGSGADWELRFETPANNNKAFIDLLSNTGVASAWVVKDGYNAKIDFANSTATSFNFSTSGLTATNGDYGTVIISNGSPAGAVTWPTNSKWVGGTAPSALTASGVDVFSFVYDGANFYWSYGLNNG